MERDTELIRFSSFSDFIRHRSRPRILNLRSARPVLLILLKLLKRVYEQFAAAYPVIVHGGDGDLPAHTLVELLRKPRYTFACDLHLAVCDMANLATSTTWIISDVSTSADPSAKSWIGKVIRFLLSPSCCFMRSSYSDEGTLPQMRLLISAQVRLSKMGGNVCQTLPQSAKVRSLSSHQR